MVFVTVTDATRIEGFMLVGQRDRWDLATG